MDEFEFLASNIRRVSTEEVIAGPGDDCSVVRWNETDLMVSTSDCLVEDVHFRWSDFSPQELAYKTMAVNMSDIAAMGARPRWFHLSLAMPQSFTEKHLEAFYREIYRVCDEQEIILLGGDLSRSTNSIFININMTGSVAKSHVQFREDFLKSDHLCVTGDLGASGAGLVCLREGLSGKSEDALIASHKKPEMLGARAEWLARQEGVHGMMDLSDGLASDLARIPKLSVLIDGESIPMPRTLVNWCADRNADPLDFALNGGEDYQILFGCTDGELTKVKKNYANEWGTPLHVIGRIDKEGDGLRIFRDGKVQSLEAMGFQHFS